MHPRPSEFTWSNGNLTAVNCLHTHLRAVDANTLQAIGSCVAFHSNDGHVNCGYLWVGKLTCSSLTLKTNWWPGSSDDAIVACKGQYFLHVALTTSCLGREHFSIKGEWEQPWLKVIAWNVIQVTKHFECFLAKITSVSGWHLKVKVDPRAEDETRRRMESIFAKRNTKTKINCIGKAVYRFG